VSELAPAYGVSLACELMGLPRSSFYYHVDEPDDNDCKGAIEEIAGQWPRYGYRRIAVQLWRDKQLVVNSKRVRRLMAEMGLKGEPPRRKRRTTNSEHSFPRYPNLVLGLQVERPEQVWVSDITYIRLRDEFVYLAVVMDIFTRSIRGWHLGRTLHQELTLIALQRALATGRRPEIHHSDQGVQYAASAYVETLQGTSISMAEVGEAWQNGYAERLIRTIKEEEVDLSDYHDYQDAYRQLGRFLDEVYMRKRIHSSLGYLTPAEFESQWLAQKASSTELV
jgi:transposase InsO family protein